MKIQTLTNLLAFWYIRNYAIMLELIYKSRLQYTKKLKIHIVYKEFLLKTDKILR